MSAIFGIYFRDGQPVERSVLDGMSERLAHRGMDGKGLWCGSSVGLGHRMLHTSPESLREVQPLVQQDGELVLTADARIDNRRELITALDLQGRPDIEITAGELILSAYRKWSSKCLERLIGDFAFVVWDGRSRTLFCARDPMGVKPFYYYESNRVFVFASEIKGLLCVSDVPRELDEVQLARFLGAVVEEREATFYRGIRRLPAAHCMEVGPQGKRLDRYWTLDCEREIRYRKDEQYVEAFQEVFTQAVRCRLASAFPVGAALSGGLDSSSIVCTARRLLEEGQVPGFHAFSAIFPGLPEPEREYTDESQYIDAVATATGIDPHRIRADRIGPLADLDRVLWHQDEPTLGINLYMHWALYKTAHQHGVRVFLDGIDGDATVSYGFGLLIDLARAERWASMTGEVKALSERSQIPPTVFLGSRVYPHLADLVRSGRWRSWFRATGEIAASLGLSRRRLFLRYGIGALLPASVIEAGKSIRRRQPKMSWIRASFARRIRAAERERALGAEGPAGVLTGRVDHGASISAPLYQYVLEVADRAAAAFSIEPRYPFFDRRLIEFCLALPMEQKLGDGWTRWILRRGMEGVLPREVQWRIGKQNLAFNYVRGLRETDRDQVDTAVFEPPRLMEEYVDTSFLRSIHSRFYSATGERGQPAKDGLILHQAVVLSRWLRDWEEDRSQAPIAWKQKPVLRAS